MIKRLIEQLDDVCIPLHVAIPEGEYEDYIKHVAPSQIYEGSFSPLHRMTALSNDHGYTHIVRICHDKIFVDVESLKKALKLVENDEEIGYLYAKGIDGTGFEIIGTQYLNLAVRRFQSSNKPIEHISYAIKEVCPKEKIFELDQYLFNGLKDHPRFLIDFPEDLEFMRSLYSHKTPLSSSEPQNLSDALSILVFNRHLLSINKQPQVTIYTCAYNDRNYIDQAIESVVTQTVFKNAEYIIIDDCSTDGTYSAILSNPHFKAGKIKLFRNEVNIGLSSSSNRALQMARGKYIVRLDSDDAFLFPFSIERMLSTIEKSEADVIYPCFIDEKSKAYLNGDVNHHVGGALFSTRKIREIEFTDKLRGWEGLDLFERAKNHITVGYSSDMPVFFYRDKKGSMSKTDLKYRAEVLAKIQNGIVGDQIHE